MQKHPIYRFYWLVVIVFVFLFCAVLAIPWWAFCLIRPLFYKTEPVV